MQTLPLSAGLVPGNQYTFEFKPDSVLDLVINTWGVESALSQALGTYATIDSVKILGTIKITITPQTSGGTVQSWRDSLKYYTEQALFGSVTFIRAEGGEAGYLPGAITEGLSGVSSEVKTYLLLGLAGLALILLIKTRG